MDFVKAQAQKIREQLAGLTPSQRMLAGSLVVIMVMTLLWWSRYAGSSEMEDVIGQDFTSEDIAQATQHIAGHGIPYRVVGNRIQVAADRRFEALALITYEHLGPRDTSSGFDDIVSKMDSPWNTDLKQNVMFNRAKEATLAQVMREWPDVRDARVVINNAVRKAFGDPTVQPTATVNLKMRLVGAKPGKKLITAAADTITGAVSGMVRSKVNVIIDGASYKAEDNGDGGGGAGGTDAWMEAVKAGEQYFTQKILDHFSRIDGLMVSVTVDPNMNRSQVEKETYDKAGTFSKEVLIDEKTDESTTTAGRPAAEPGIVPNTGGANTAASVAGAGSGEGSTTNSTQNQTKLQVFPAFTREWVTSPAGAAAVVGASIGVPRSHFVKIYKAINPTAKDPDEATLQPLIDSELRTLKRQVLGCISKTPIDKIEVDPYLDYLPAVDTAAQPAAATSFPLALAGHAKEIALGALAMVSLFMVSMMVRKATPVTIIPPQPEKAVATLSATRLEDHVGEASEGGQSMDALEVDDDSIRTQQMVGQVSNLVKENPDAAASLVKRWLNRS
jgi:flagellar biosynthesis/type III secretory pathway M-ring protein FliF/YscJ